MLIRCSTKLFDGDASQQSHDWHTSGQYFGQQAHGQRHALWYMHVFGQSHGCSCHSSSAGCSSAYALCTHDHGALGARRTHSADRKHACAEQQLQIDVHVGWRHFHQRAGAIHGDGALSAHLSKPLIEKKPTCHTDSP